MGKRGPPPKPAALKKLDGNPGCRPIPEEVITPPASDVSAPPAHLSEVAQQEWRRLYGPMQRSGLLTLTDLSAFEVYCAAYGRWREAQQALATQARLLKTPNGAVQPNPWLTIERQQAELVKGYLIEFGLTPAARARMATSVPSLPNNGGDAPPPSQPEMAGKFKGLVGRA